MHVTAFAAPIGASWAVQVAELPSALVSAPSLDRVVDSVVRAVSAATGAPAGSITVRVDAQDGPVGTEAGASPAAALDIRV